MSISRNCALILWVGLAFGLTQPSVVVGQNLVNNPDFETNLDLWVIFAGGTLAWASDDYEASTESGSVAISPPTADGETTATMEQCVVVDPSEPSQLKARSKTPAGTLITGFVSLVRFTDASCQIFESFAESLTFSFSGNDGSWRSRSTQVDLPAGTGSVTVRLTGRREDAGFMTILFDGIEFGPVGPMFDDGFEAGDFSAWSE